MFFYIQIYVLLLPWLTMFFDLGQPWLTFFLFTVSLTLVSLVLFNLYGFQFEKQGTLNNRVRISRIQL